MLLECTAIITVILVLAYMLARYDKGSVYALGALPLIIVPAVHMMGRRLSLPLGRLLRIQTTTAYIGMDLCALMLTCVLLGVVSASMKKRQARWSYLFICGGFTAVLTCVLLVRTVLL